MLTTLDRIPPNLARSAVRNVMNYPFKVWGFGEDIALRALQEYSRVTGEPEGAAFVRDLVRPWCNQAKELVPADHVAPGAAILELFEQTGEDVYLEAARRLGDLYQSFSQVDGVAVHRPDLADLSTLIWEDCLALDGPFLARLAMRSARYDLLELAVHTVLAYTAALLDEATGLFRHGFDVRSKKQSECNWGRGNGWAMHGLIDTLEVLPEDHPTFAALRALLHRQIQAVVRLQDQSGLWHTILDDADSPLENSTAALFSSAVLKAERLGLLEASEDGSLLSEVIAGMLERALAALSLAIRDDGGLPISYATPVGNRNTYITAPLGVFPWGQGPLILTFTEVLRTGTIITQSGDRAPNLNSGGKQE